jgi:Xaa-Pro aminopeptidase
MKRRKCASGAGREPSQERGPALLEREELAVKLAHCTAELARAKADAIVFSQEGAMRWLTGTRHEIAAISPDAPSPVQAIVRAAGSRVEIAFFTTRIEMPRVKDQVPAVFTGHPGLAISFHETPPSGSGRLLAPPSPECVEVMGRIVRPVVGGLEGNQYAKLSWLCAATTAALAETAGELAPGMDGALVRAKALASLLRRDIDSNLVLVALAGQERHLHPLWESRYRIEKDCWVKLVAGARYAEAIISATVMVKFGSRPSPEAQASYRALQEGVVEYADCYRAAAVEGEIYTETGRRFESLGRKHGIPGFGAAAYAHHPGGPTSPIGNRDYLLEERGTRTMFPWMQFAINPVEPRHSTKVELQGIVMPDGPPHSLDASRFTPSRLLSFTEIVSANGTQAKVADILQR